MLKKETKIAVYLALILAILSQHFKVELISPNLQVINSIFSAGVTHWTYHIFFTVSEKTLFPNTDDT